MKLLKTTFFSSIITLIKISTSFISNKVVAVFVGPSGIAVLGQFVNFFNVILIVSTGAIGTGVIKYTAEYVNDKVELNKLIGTSLMITFYSTLFCSVVLMTFSTSISYFLFNSNFYSKPIFFIGVTILFYSLNSLVLSFLNGKGEIKKYTIINSISSIVGLILTLILVYYFNILGAVYSLIFAQSVVFIFSLFLVIKEKWFSLNAISFKIDYVMFKKLMHFSLMSITSSLTMPISQIILRNLIIDRFGLKDAGVWQGMMRISDGYLLLITTSLSIYYLPKLTSIANDNIKIKDELISGYKIIIPILIISETVIYVYKFHIINLLYSASFDSMSSLFFWQLLGDFFKITSWLLSFLLLAKSMTKIFVFSEVIFTIIYVLLGIILTKYLKLPGMSLAFCINYFLYLIFMIYKFREILFFKLEYRNS